MKKKIIATALFLSMLLSLFACGGGGNGEAPETEGDREVTYQSTVSHSFDKMITNRRPSGSDGNEYTLYMAKGETEGMQMSLLSSAGGRRMVFRSTSGDIDAISRETYILDVTHSIFQKHYTDPASDYSETGSFTLYPKEAAVFLVEFTTTKDTPAGEYVYTFEFADSKGNRIKEYKITVKVWDIEMPEKHNFSTAVYIGRANIQQYHSYCTDITYVKYYELLLDHNISAYDLPYDILDDRADVYMSDPRVTSFRVPSDVSDTKLLQYYEKLKTNEDWLGKAYFYPADEPYTLELIEQFMEKAAHLRELCPDIRITSAIYTDLELTSTRDQVDEMAEYVDLWCPKLCMWDDEMAYKALDKYSPAPFADRMDAMKERGDDMWTYVCNAPNAPYAALFVDHSGIAQRSMFWQMFERNIDGFLYWSSTAWTWPEVVNPWKSVNTGMKDDKDETVFGEGILIYPAKIKSQDDPVATIRLKYIRDGIDDWELFNLASEVLGEDFVLQQIEKVTPSLTSFTESTDVMAQARIEIGNALEAALASAS